MWLRHTVLLMNVISMVYAIAVANSYWDFFIHRTIVDTTKENKAKLRNKWHHAINNGISQFVYSRLLYSSPWELKLERTAPKLIVIAWTTTWTDHILFCRPAVDCYSACFLYKSDSFYNFQLTAMIITSRTWWDESRNNSSPSRLGTDNN